MQLRALAHRSKTLSLRDQIGAVSGGRVFTTLGTKPRENVGDPVELDSGDEEDEALPAAVEEDPARQARLVGELSDCTDPESEGEGAACRLPGPPSPCSLWDSEEEYPQELRVLSRTLPQVLQDAEDWQRARIPAPSPPAAGPAKKKTRRGGRANKPRAKWTAAQRKAEKESVAYSNRIAIVRGLRQNQRLAERDGAPGPVASKHFSTSEQYDSTFRLTDLASNRSPFVAARIAPAGKAGTTSPVFMRGFSRHGLSGASRAQIRWVLRQALGPPAGCNKYVRDLVKQSGFTYVPSASCAQVFTDADGIIYAVKVAQPSSEDWAATVKYFTEYLHKLRAELKISHASNVRHLRGDFVRMTWGTSHGGGRKHPATIAPDWKRNKEKLVAFFSDQTVQRVCRHLQRCVFTWFPEVASFYADVGRELKEGGVDLQAVFGPGSEAFNLPFAAHTLNLGPYVRCLLHRDAQNWPEGICPAMALGEFDHTKGGQFVMEEPKVVLELRSGDIILFLSSLITHGNAPLQEGDVRMSWTCWMARGLVRWLAAGRALVSSLTTRAKQERYAARSREFEERGWNSLLTLEELASRLGGQGQAE